MRRAILLLAAIGALACGGGDKKSAGRDTDQSASDKKHGDDQADAKDMAKAAGGLIGGFMKMAAAQDSIDKTNPYHALEDPCILVTRAEVEKYIGPLRADPWREGSKCVYDAASGRSVTLDVSYSGGKAAMKMMKAVGGLTNLAIVDESGKADTLDGDWDQVRWQYGSLAALKGDVMVDVDVEASRAGPVGGAELANIALKRLPSPLHYDGDAAAAHKPGPLVAPKDPCSLVTKDEATAILGKLVGDPTSDEHSCTFTVPSPLREGTTMPVELQVQWKGGFYDFGQEKEASGLAQKSFIGPTMDGSGVGQLEEKAKTDTQARKDLEQVRATMSGMGGPALKDGSLEFKTDTSVTGGPWDEAAVLSGFTFAAVKKDVFMKMDLRLLGEPKAKALVAKAMSRI
jgi:hypothetical protein